MNLFTGSKNTLVAEIVAIMFVGIDDRCILETNVLGAMRIPAHDGLCPWVNSHAAQIPYLVDTRTVEVQGVRIVPQPGYPGRSWALPYHHGT